jgi:hypothetical protein
MKLRVAHTTHYDYAEKVLFTPHLVVLRPRENHQTHVLDFQLTTVPSGRITWMRDTQENSIARCIIEGSSKQLVIHAEITVELLQTNPFDFLLEPHAANLPFSYNESEQASLAASLLHLADSSQVSAWVTQALGQRQGPTLDILTKLNSHIFQTLTYNRREEMGLQTPNETLTLRSGSCRDFALLFMAACRELNLACRFVSGYLYVPPLLGQTPSENRADNAMHAWCEVYIPGAGWLGFDPTHGILTNNNFIPVAVTSFPETVNPVQGSYLNSEPVENALRVEVSIEKISF